ncbi:LysR family transcriptional regulator [Cupriavidus necator]|uniref:LysR family transcriptional regulator n=1 Tax=Cupriavidus necator TaxID=106590 RepID=UPI0005B442CA|nr:LysR family transcriptional regulator [Cupriavidus necator]
MNQRQLRYFCEVVDAGSAAEAAKRLFVAPTAISMQLAQLEESVGAPLFDRTHRPMTLTAVGRFLYPRARDVLTMLGRLEEETRAVAAGSGGWLGIGFTRSAIFSILPAAVRRFRAARPNVQVDLLELLSEHQPEQLRRGRIDIGISRYVGVFEQAPDLVYTPLFHDPFIAAVPASSSLGKRKMIRAEELNGMSLIRYPKDPQSGFAAHMMALLRDAGVGCVAGHEAIEIHTALGLVAAGLGFTLVGHSVADGNRSDIAFVPITGLKGTATIVAVTRKDDDSALVSSFLAALQADARD